MTVRLYVGNLPEDVDRQALEDLFASAGEVISTKVIRDRKTGKCRGFGFLTVATDAIAETYIEKFNGTEFGGITLKLEVAQPRERTEESSESESSDTASSAPRPSGGSSVIKRKDNNSARERGGSRPNPAVAAESASGPDPRWADQLQRIKEQLQAAGQN
ncbi:MAG: RNA-binding protein [Synechococcaceae cyanobacterium SM2_3_2]|nr:RNA-binding protein [Synechococcaceae cyanobacterium SM2_3_2]